MVLLALSFIAFWRMERWVSFWCFFGAGPRHLIPVSVRQNSGFGQLRELACKGLIWLPVFRGKRMVNRKNRKIPGSTGKTGNARLSERRAPFGLCRLEGASGAQNAVIGIKRPDDLKPDRQPGAS